MVSDALLFASSGGLLPEIAAAQPPAPGARPAGRLELAEPGASNGWALGSERTAAGGGMLLANPHFPWEGPNRFTEVHLTLPGMLDVYGASLGLPGVQIGFNEHVAWTHTVSSGQRFTAYVLSLVPDHPTRYRYGDGTREMTPDEVRVEVRQPDGTLMPVTRTLWSSHYGPMLAVEPGWTDELAFTLRDANAETTGALEQWLGMDTASGMDDLQRVHRDIGGIPWVNTIATSRDGRAWYADASATPNLSADALDRYGEAVAAGGLAAAFAEQGVVVLDGADPRNEWVDVPGAPAPGLVPYPAVPQLERRDYVFNANDSYWLANPRALLTGFSPLHGEEERLYLPRTKTNVGELERPGSGPGGKWRLEDVTAAFWSNRSVLPGLLREPVVAACRAAGGPVAAPDGTVVDLDPACDALASWDGTYDTGSRGALLWREFLAGFDRADLVDAGALFADRLDPADPAGTPRVPVPERDRDPWRTALAGAVTRLAAQGIAEADPLGRWQYDARTGLADERIGLPGGTNTDGVVNIVDCCSGYVSPSGGPAVGRPSGPGYPITRGASFVLAVELLPQGPPVARAVLTYGNPDDPTDPYFSAGSRSFAAEQLRDVAFTRADVMRGTRDCAVVHGAPGGPPVQCAEGERRVASSSLGLALWSRRSPHSGSRRFRRQRSRPGRGHAG
ncbi:MAG: penicillin acylase family protein [Egibacteraceae bacterium]